MGYVILNGVNSPFLLGMRPLAYRTAPGRFFVALVLSCAGLSAVTRLGIAQGPAFRVAHLVEGSARAATPRGVIVSRTTLFAPDFLGSVIKTVSDVNGGNLVPGDTLEYVITATNSGTTNAKFVIFIDAIPTNSTYVTSSLRVVSGPNTGAKTDAIGDDQAQFEAPQNRVRFRLGIGATGTKAGTILTGASTSWRFRTTVNPAVAVGTIISNIGTLSFTDSLTGVDRLQLSLPPGGIAVGEPTTIPVTAPDLTIAKSHTGTFLRGQNATYTLVVTNVGNGVTTAISSVSDVLPAGLTPVAATGAGWNCTIAGQTLSCSHPGPVAAGASFPPIALTVNVSPSAPSALTNTATVSGGGETNIGNNSASDPTTIADPAVDLAIVKSTSAPSFTVGSNATYALDVSNVSSLNTFAAITVSDVLPAGLTFVSASGGGWTCSHASGTVTCTHPGPVSGGASLPSISLTVAIGAAALPSVTNTATVATIGDAVAGNNSSSVLTPVNPAPAPDLSITKTAGGAFVVGSTGTYSLAVSNVGTGATTGSITVTDVLPTGLSFVSASGTGWTCINTSGTVSCTHPGPLNPSTALPTISLSVAIGAAAAPSVTNTATVGTPGDTNGANDSGVAVTPVSLAPVIDLALAKSHTGNFVVGGTHAFSLAVTNVGTIPTTGPLTITDVLPGAVSFASFSGSGWSCSAVAATVTCTNPAPLAAGVTSIVTLNVLVGPGAYPGFTNTASVATPGDANAGNDAASDPVVVETIDLSIAKTASSPFVVGSNATYSLVVTNLSPRASNSLVTVSDTLPAGLTFVSAIGTGWSCSNASGGVSCTTPGPIAGGASAAPITLTVSVGPAASPNVTNRAWVGMSSDLIPANNSSSVTTPVTTPAPDLTVVKGAGGAFTVGANGTYSLDVSNVGAGATTGVISVSDVLPPGLTFVSAVGAGWSCGHASGTVTCTHPGPLGAGASLATVTVTVAVGPAAVPSVLNTATVTTAGDSNAGNNSSTISTPVGAAPVLDLAVAKSHAGNFVVGSVGNFTLAVSSVGTAPTTGAITVTDVLPAGLTFVAATGAGWSCGSAAGTVTCTSPGPLAAGATLPPITLSVLVGSAAFPSVSNTATVSTPGDANGVNDGATDPVTVETVDLTIVKSATSLFSVGASASYSLVVSNTSSQASNAAITVTDTLPAGLALVSATGSGWTCGTSGSIVSCTTPGPVAGNASLPPITLTVTVSAAALPSVTNRAHVAMPNDLVPGNNSSSVTTPVSATPVVDLTITKTHVGVFAVGTVGVYTIGVRNAGTTATTGTITVSDNLPGGLAFVSGVGGGWTCGAVGALVTCTNAGPLAAGATSNIALSVAVSASAIPSVTNTVTVTTPGDIDPGNNSASDPTGVVSVPDLSISKVATSAFVVGQNATYVLDVTNVSPGATSGPITVTDLLPPGLSYVAATGAGFTCSASGQTVTCSSAGPLNPGQSVGITLTVLVGAAASPSVTNTASVVTPGDLNPGNNSSSVTTPVASGVDLAITKSSSVLVSGGTGRFTIGVSNVGGGATTGTITVLDNLPVGLVFVSASGTGFSCSAIGQLVTCTRATPLTPGQSVTLTIVVTVTAPAGSTVNNTATVSTPGDTNLPNNSASTGPIPVGALLPDLTVSKSITGAVLAGGNVTFSLVVRNVGGGSTTGPIVVTDTLQAGLTFVSGTGAGWSCQASGQVVTCTSPGPLAPNASATLTIVAAVASSATSIANIATVVTPGDTVGGNNSGGTGTTPVGPAPDLSITKTAVGTFSVGVPATYTLTVSNVGAGPTVGSITVTDVLPASLTFVSAGGNGWSCVVSGSTVTCTNPGPLAAGASSSITLTVVPTAAAVPSVTNTATVATPGDPNGGNNSGSTTTPVGGIVDLALSKVGPDSVTIGAPAVYSLTIRNVGTVATSGTITLVDTLPTGLTFQSASGGGFSCNAAANIVTCTRSSPPLAPNATATVEISVLVTSSAVSPVINRACVATAADANAANNCASTAGAIGGSVDLVMTKDVNGPFVVGKPGRFVLGVRNVGSAPAAPTIVVVDTLPAGLAFVSASPNDWMCAAAGSVVTCLRSTALAPGANTSIELTVSVSALAVPGVTNCARVSAPNESGSRLNNVSCVGVDVNGLGALEIEKKVSKAEASIGDVLDYTIVVKNSGTGDIIDAIVSDTLPVGFALEARSVRQSGASVADPAGAPGPLLTFTVGRIPKGASVTLTYRVRIGAAARVGINTNVAVASSPSGGTTSPPAVASTRLVGGVFEERGAILGKVYIQCNCQNALQDRGEVGVPGVRVYLEDGSSTVTDVEGKYSFYNVASRLHVVKLDRASLPAGAVMVPLGNRNAGDGYSRFADVKAGELHKADFAEGSGSSEVLERVLMRRRGGEVNNAGDRPVAPPPASRDGRGAGAPTSGGVSGDAPRAYSPLLGQRTLTEMNSQLPITPLRARAEQNGRNPSASGRVQLDVYEYAIPADGQTFVPVRIRVLDASGNAVTGRVAATLEASLGRWTNATPLEVANAGWHVTLEHGEGTYYLNAPTEPGRGEIRVTTDYGDVTRPVAFVPSIRAFTATGLLNARVDFRALLKGSGALASNADGFEETLRDWSTRKSDGSTRAGARGALFMKGRVPGDRLLTLSYDSERDRGRTHFRDIRPDEFFPTYGDAALREFDAQSRRRFFARIDDGTSYTMFGDFQTSRAGDRRILSAYDRTLNGAVQHFEGARGQATLFASQGRMKQIVDELPGRGISGPYALTRAEGLINSERVEIITRDRNQPSVILTRTVLTRFADYTIEALTGRLIFRNPVPSADANLNPVSIRVTYEAEATGGKTFWVYGGDASLRLSSRVEVGGTYARDENPLSITTLGGMNATARLGVSTFVMGEWARTSAGSIDGSAARVELRHQSERLEGRAFAARSDSAFNNTSSTFVGGRTEFGGRFAAKVTDATRIVGEALHTEDNVRDGVRNGVLLAMERQLNRAWRAEFGYRYAKESGAQSPNQSYFIPTDRDVSALRGRLTWTLPEQTRSALFAEYEQDVRDASYRGAIGGEYLVANRARLYGRHEWLSSFEGAYATNGGRNQQYTVFGIDADYLKNTRMFSEYRARDAFSGRDAEASIGLRNRWALGPGLTVNTSFERVAPLIAGSPVNALGPSGDALAVTGGVEWTRPALWKSTARLEFRNADTGDNMLASFGYARKLSRNWTMLGRTLWDVADLTNNQTRGWSQLGFAWRETDRNRWNALMRYENRVEHIGAVAAAPGTETIANILAALVNLQPTSRLTLSGRYAAKSARDGVGALRTRSTAQLLMGRGIFDLNRRLDVGAIGSLLASDGLSSRQYGLGGELGLLVMKNLRVAGGYNLFGFTDKDLNTFGTTRKGAYLELGFKFDEALFGLGGATQPCESACRAGGKKQ